MCVSGYPNMRLSCRNALPNVRLSVPDTAASIAGANTALSDAGRNVFRMGTAGWLWHGPRPSSRSGGRLTRFADVLGGSRAPPSGSAARGLVGRGRRPRLEVPRAAHRPTRRPAGVETKRRADDRQGVRVGTITLSLLVGLWAIGFRFTDLLVGTAVSAVIGIILAPLVGNFINGVFILADQPFEIGDMIELENGTTGFVEDITIRYTKIFTLDNTFLVVPNGTMRERDVTNYSAEDERTRRTIEVLVVTYESDVSEARRLIIGRAARDCDAVIDGGPDIRVGVARATSPARTAGSTSSGTMACSFASGTG